MTGPITGPGTAEPVWRAWSGPDAWPSLDLDGRHVVAVAPHPDDETLGVGGTLVLLARLGATVELVAVTDGEASHPGSSVLPPDRLAAARVAETAAALAALDLVGTPVTRLGLPDGGVARWEQMLTASLAGLLRRGSWCLATWAGDGHPDHEATGRAAADACAQVGARLLEYPVWAWHWASPDDSRVPWSRAARVLLPPEVRSAKRAAVTAYRSQVAPLGPAAADAAVLPPEVVAHFGRGFETVFR